MVAPLIILAMPLNVSRHFIGIKSDFSGEAIRDFSDDNLRQRSLSALKVLYHRQCQYTQANEYNFDGANSIETTNH